MSTTIPTVLTPENLLMYYLTINDISLQEIGRLPSWSIPEGTPDLVGEIMMDMALRGSTGEQLQNWLHAQPESVQRRQYSSIRIVHSSTIPMVNPT